jgi:UDP-N-acetylmuramyl pentapeptide synthase
VGPAHLEFLGSLDGVYEAKSELIDALPASGVVVLNAEDAYGTRMRRRFAGRAVMLTQAAPTAAFAEAAPGKTQVMRLAVSRSGLEGTVGTLEIGDESHAFHFPLLGRHLAYAGMMAVAIGRELGIPIADLLAGLGDCKPTTHRMEVRQGRVMVLDDCYNANPSSTKAALSFLEEVEHGGRKIAVLGDMLEMGETGPAAHREIVELLAGSKIAKVHLVGKLYADALAAVGSMGERFAAHPSTDALAAVLPASLEPTDLVLLKGSRGIKLDKLLPLLGA